LRDSVAADASDDAGMMKLVVPIFLNGEFLGVAGGKTAEYKALL
jgi:hypothetical protein